MVLKIAYLIGCLVGECLSFVCAFLAALSLSFQTTMSLPFFHRDNGSAGPSSRGTHANNVGAGKAWTTFSFGVWLRLHGVDLLTMAAMGAIGLGIYEARTCFCLK